MAWRFLQQELVRNIRQSFGPGWPPVYIDLKDRKLHLKQLATGYATVTGDEIAEICTEFNLKPTDYFTTEPIGDERWEPSPN